jgi:hypothetical protein
MPKTYTIHIQFHAVGYTVKAQTAAQAKKKALRKLSKRSLLRLIDHQNLWIDHQ